MASAARQLGTTQPSASQTVADIETRTRVELFDRKMHPIGLTPAGAVLRQHAAILLAGARQIGPLLRQAGRSRLPFPRVGLVDSLIRALAVTVAGFLSDVADRSSLVSGVTASHTAALLCRQIDLVLEAEELEVAEGLERHVLLEEPYTVLCLEGEVPPASVQDLSILSRHSPLVRFDARSRTDGRIELHLRRLGPDIPRHLESDTPY